MSFLDNRYARVLTAVLLLQATAFYAVASRSERAPLVSPLSSFRPHSADGAMSRDVPIEKEVQEHLESRRHAEPRVRQLLSNRLRRLFLSHTSRRSGMARRHTLRRTACLDRGGSGGNRDADHRRSGWNAPL